MYSFKKVFPWLVLAGIAAGFNRPAVAQFEVAPDHFTDAQSRNVTQEISPVQRLNREITAVQQELEGYYSAIARQREAVDQAQEVAAGAGGMGDSAYIFIDEYVRQRRVLDQLQKDLAPRIVLAQAQMDALRQAQMASATPAPPSSATTVSPGKVKQGAVLIAAVPKTRK